MSDRKAMVSVPIDEWDDIRNKQQRILDENAELRKQLAAAERADSTGKLQPTIDTVEAAIPIVQFAVSNLHPDAVRGWPHAALAEFADRLEQMPGATQLQKELSIELRAFALQARARENERAGRPVHDA